MTESFNVGDRVIVGGIDGVVVEAMAGKGRFKVRLCNGHIRRVRERWISPAERKAPDPGHLTRTPDYALGERRAQPKDAPARDAKYLDFVRTRACAACGSREAIQAHHFHDGHGTMGGKCSDYRTCPLCPECHGEWHSKGYFPFKTREQSIEVQLSSQRYLLDDWIEETMSAVEAVDALVKGLT